MSTALVERLMREFGVAACIPPPTTCVATPWVADEAVTPIFSFLYRYY